MRTQIITYILLAGTVDAAGAASGRGAAGQEVESTR